MIELFRQIMSKISTSFFLQIPLSEELSYILMLHIVNHTEVTSCLVLDISESKKDWMPFICSQTYWIYKSSRVNEFLLKFPDWIAVSNTCRKRDKLLIFAMFQAPVFPHPFTLDYGETHKKYNCLFTVIITASQSLAKHFLIVPALLNANQNCQIN